MKATLQDAINGSAYIKAYTNVTRDILDIVELTDGHYVRFGVFSPDGCFNRWDTVIGPIAHQDLTPRRISAIIRAWGKYKNIKAEWPE